MGRSTLLIVLGFIIIFGYLAMQMQRVARRAEENSTQFAEKTIVRQIANSALEFLISLHSTTGAADTSITHDDWLGGSFNGSITTVAYDSSTGENLISFSVIATVGNETHSSSATLRSRNLLIPVIPAAIGIFANTVDLSIAGNAHIYGNDTNIDGTAGSQDDLPGITVSEEDDSVALNDDYDGTTYIQGSGDSPSIAVFTESDMAAIEDLAEAYHAIADYDLSSCSGFTGNVTLGSVDSPVIVYISGDCTISGNLTGYGVLIAEGITFKGNVNWYGIVIITGVPVATFTSKGNTKIYGSLLIGVPTISLTFKGNDRIYYSSEAIQIIDDEISSSGNSLMSVSDIVWWN